MSWPSLHVLICRLSVPFSEASINVFCPFSTWISFLNSWVWKVLYVWVTRELLGIRAEGGGGFALMKDWGEAERSVRRQGSDLDRDGGALARAAHVEGAAVTGFWLYFQGSERIWQQAAGGMYPQQASRMTPGLAWATSRMELSFLRQEQHYKRVALNKV